MSERGFFAERLRQLREQAGFSQPGLAECSGVAVSTIRQFEYGLREPTYGTLVKLAAGLRVSLSAFDAPAAESEASPSGEQPKRRDRPKKSAATAAGEQAAEKESLGQGTAKKGKGGGGRRGKREV